MKELLLETPISKCSIILAPWREGVCRFLTERSLFVVDRKLYEVLPALQEFSNVLLVDGGEQVKSITEVERLWREFALFGLQRSTVLIVIGGGSVCDAVAFAAATYMRGIGCVLVPSTLLGQVDAAIGGKNGVNLLVGGAILKNLIGTIRQPLAVVCDIQLLSTLPQQQFVDGLAEVLKYGLILDSSILNLLENAASEIFSRDAEVIKQLVEKSIRSKINVVARDEMERADRIALNFGHTFAHAVELEHGVSHGQAVALGILVDCVLSCRIAGLDLEVPQRVERLLEKLGFKTRIGGCTAESLAQAFRSDKKLNGDLVSLALMNRIGSFVVKNVGIDDIIEAAQTVCKLG